MRRSHWHGRRRLRLRRLRRRRLRRRRLRRRRQLTQAPATLAAYSMMVIESTSLPVVLVEFITPVVMVIESTSLPVAGVLALRELASCRAPGRRCLLTSGRLGACLLVVTRRARRLSVVDVPWVAGPS